MGLVTQIILIILTLIVIYSIYSITRSVIRENRISSYALSSKDLDKVSLFERLNRIKWKLIRFLSNNLGETKTVVALSHDYEKYIMTFERSYKKPIDFMTIKILSTILSIILVVLLIVLEALPNNMLLLVLFMIIGFIVPDGFWMISYYYKCSEISKKLYQSIIIISNSLTKYNIIDSVGNVIKEIDGPIKDEYRKLLIDLSYNISTVDAYKKFYDRTNIKEIKSIIEILSINSTNLSAAFNLIRNKFDYLSKKEAITSNINSVLNILAFIYLLLPLVFIVMILIIYPNYFEVLKYYKFGFLIILVLISLYIMLIIAIRSVLEDRT